MSMLGLNLIWTITVWISVFKILLRLALHGVECTDSSLQQNDFAIKNVLQKTTILSCTFFLSTTYPNPYNPSVWPIGVRCAAAFASEPTQGELKCRSKIGTTRNTNTSCNLKNLTKGVKGLWWRTYQPFLSALVPMTIECEYMMHEEERACYF